MSIVRQMHFLSAPVFSIVKKDYFINEYYLLSLGFSKNEKQSQNNEWVYRYESPFTIGNGLELLFLRDYGIISVKEFWTNDGMECCTAHSLIGQFRINSDEDLEFIFSKNVRLHYIFNVANKRV